MAQKISQKIALETLLRCFGIKFGIGSRLAIYSSSPLSFFVSVSSGVFCHIRTLWLHVVDSYRKRHRAFHRGR